MGNILTNLFSSVGLKRRLVAWLSTIVGILLAIPVLPASLQGAVAALNKAIELLGGVAVIHAGAKGTLVTRGLILSIAAAVNGLILLASWVPALGFLVPILTPIVPYLNALAAGTTLAAASK